MVIRKYKVDEKSRVEFFEVVDEFVDGNGIKHQSGTWKTATGEISLGSISKPNKKILAIKIISPSKKSPIDIFKGFLGED